MLKAVPKGFYSAYQYMCTVEQVFLAIAVRIQKEIDPHGYQQLVRVSVFKHDLVFSHCLIMKGWSAWMEGILAFV